MTSDDLDTWRVIYGRIVGADFKYGISFALNNCPEAQNSCKVRIITAEMSYETAYGTRDLVTRKISELIAR